jgi:hypothetical protein
VKQHLFLGKGRETNKKDKEPFLGSHQRANGQVE